MKKHMYAILLAGLSASVFATEKNDTELFCDDTKTIINTLKEKYKEVPILLGKTDDIAKSTMSVWVNFLTKDWTIIATKKDMTCIVGTGSDATLISHKSKTTI